VVSNQAMGSVVRAVKGRFLRKMAAFPVSWAKIPRQPLGYNDGRRIPRVADENNYSAPNGVRFKICVVNGYGKWRCAECGQTGVTDHEYGEHAESQAKLKAREHSGVCGAGRGAKPT
jgi:hypothetical protein